MSKLSIAQRIAKCIGIPAGSTAWFSPDITDPDNGRVYTSLKPSMVGKSLGCVDSSDLGRIVKTRLLRILGKV